MTRNELYLKLDINIHKELVYSASKMEEECKRILFQIFDTR